MSPSRSAAAKKGDPRREDTDDEITIERRVRMPIDAMPMHPTQRMDKIDARLLAIARGELEPDDPFGGLIPIYDEQTLGDDDIITEEAQENWLSLEPAPSSEEAMLGVAIPRLRLQPEQLLDLDLSVSAAFLVSHVDGKRSIHELNEICRFDDLESLELLDELLRLGAIELF